eukprot:3675129-Pleurochrysis_carterae.AAC.2
MSRQRPTSAEIKCSWLTSFTYAQLSTDGPRLWLLLDAAAAPCCRMASWHILRFHPPSQVRTERHGKGNYLQYLNS